jgi:hypothetical protein
MPPADGMPGGPIPPGFFSGKQYDTKNNHRQCIFVIFILEFNDAAVTTNTPV